MTISSEVVSVAITLADRAPIAANFGTPAIFCNAPYIGGRSYELSPEGLAAMVTDGFALTNRGYLMAQSMCSQAPHTETVVIYNRAANNAQAIDLTPTNTTVGFVYEFELVSGTTAATITFTVVTGTVAAIVTGIVAAIAASSVSALVTETDSTTKVTVAPTVAGTHIQVNGAPRELTVKDTSPDAGIATDLAAAALVHDFYAFVIDSYSELEANAAATWAEANAKLFLHQSADTTDWADAAGTGVAKDFSTAAYNRSAVVPTRDMSGNAAAGLLARQLSQDPGTSSWAFKDITGADPDSFTATESTNLKGKNALPFILDSGARHTLYGKAASGRSFRITQAIDLLEARIKEAVLDVFLNNEYVPYSQEGFDQIEAAIRGVLSRFSKPRTGFIDPTSIQVVMPDPATATTADKAAGLINSVRFSCTIPADALRVVVKGTVAL
jgi:hypothetical protein